MPRYTILDQFYYAPVAKCINCISYKLGGCMNANIKPEPNCSGYIPLFDEAQIKSMIEQMDVSALFGKKREYRRKIRDLLLAGQTAFVGCAP